jgi:hypothetical protein
MEIKGNTEKDTVTFHLIKSGQFQSLRVDGALGSISPAGISLSFFVERRPIPQTMTHEVFEDGALGNVIDAQGKNGIIRELQSGILLDEETARSLRDQLSKMLLTLEKTENGSH